MQAALHWLAACLCAGLLTWILKLTGHVQHPVAAIAGSSFPDAYTGMSLVVYGFLALLIARELPLSRRWLPYLLAGLLVTPIALSRLYLGAQWFSDVLAGVSLGIFWVALIGIAYDRHRAPVLPVRQVLLVTAILLVAGMTWQTRQHMATELARYEPRIQAQAISHADWIQGGWQTLPAYRIDLEGQQHQPINFQWSGSLAALREALAAQGWRQAPEFQPAMAMNWLAPEPDITALPVLPEVNDGRHQVLLMIAPHADGEETLTVLRLWPSDRRLVDRQLRIWTGKVAPLYIEDGPPLISYLRTGNDFVKPVELLGAALRASSVPGILAVRRDGLTGDSYWQGQVLLAWESAP